MTASAQPAWWQSGIFYNLYVRSFQDANGDGIGDLTGVLNRLDYLDDILGVDVIWLSGILASPWKENGFDVSDFCDVHPAFGTLETFDELLRQAHRRGMKILIDYVPNHTSDQHAWFLESSSSRTNPKRDWYVWRDPKEEGSPPNNWLSPFGGPSWEWSETTWQYYLHSFLKEQPDLNWRSPALKEAMFDVARFWLERGVDGFRVDAAHHILKDPKLRDNPPGKPRDIGGKKLATEYQDHIHDREHPGLHRIYREFRQVLDAYSQNGQPRGAFAEVHPSGGWRAWSKYYGEKLDEFHFPLNNGFIFTSWEAEKIRTMVKDIEAALPPGAWPNHHTGNFDEWRAVTRYGYRPARVAAMLLLTLRGTPLLYYGEEIGMTNTAVAPEYETDPFGKRVGLSRDPMRTPMQWDPSPYAGFSSHTTARTWLPVAPNYRNINVETELQDPHSMLNLYRELINLRKSSPALTVGSFHTVEPVPDDCFVYLREQDDERMLAALNFSSQPKVIPIPDMGMGEVLLSTDLDRTGRVDLNCLEVRGDEGLLIRV